MKTYRKPVLNVIEFRVDESLMAGSMFQLVGAEEVEGTIVNIYKINNNEIAS